MNGPQEIFFSRPVDVYVPTLLTVLSRFFSAPDEDPCCNCFSLLLRRSRNRTDFSGVPTQARGPFSVFPLVSGDPYARIGACKGTFHFFLFAHSSSLVRSTAPPFFRVLEIKEK